MSITNSFPLYSLYSMVGWIENMDKREGERKGHMVGSTFTDRFHRDNKRNGSARCALLFLQLFYGLIAGKEVLMSNGRSKNL